MMVTVVFSESLHATATVFPSIECTDEKHRVKDVFGIEGMVLIRPPV